MEDDLFLDDVEKAAALESIIRSLERAPNSLLFKSIRAMKTGSLACVHDECHRQEEALRLIRQAKDLCCLEDEKSPSFRDMALEMMECKIVAPQMVEMNVGELIGLADKYNAASFYRAEILTLFLAGTVLLATRFLNEHPDRAKEQAIEQRAENLLDRLGHSQLLYASGLGYHTPLLEDADLCNLWWDSFMENHSEYSVWRQRITLQLQWQTHYVQSEKFRASLLAKQSAEVIRTEWIDFWRQILPEGDLAHLSLMDADQQLTKTSNVGFKKSHFFPRYFFEDYNSDITIANPENGTQYFGSLGSNDFTTLRQKPFTALLDWLSTDFRNGFLLPLDLASILEKEAVQTESELNWEDPLKSLNVQLLTDMIYGTDSQPISFDRWSDKLKILQNWLRETNSFPHAQTQFMLIELLRARIMRRLPNELLIQECRRNLKFIPNLESAKDLRKMGDQVALFKHQCQLNFVQAAHRSWIHDTWTTSMESLFDEAIKMLDSTFTEYPIEKSNADFFEPFGLNMRGMFYHEYGMLLFSKFDCYAPISVDTALKHLWLAEICSRVERGSLGRRNGFRAYEDHLKALEQPWVRNIFPLALRLQTTLQSDDSVSLQASVWHWIQHAKSRGWDALGCFRDQNHKYSEVPPISDVEQSLETGFGLTQLQTMATAAGQKILFIDYYTDFFWGAVGSPVLVAYTPGMPNPQLHKLESGPDISELHLFKGHFLKALEPDSQSGRRMSEFWLQKFEFLVQPILNLCEEGDVVVLSPCGLLHGIPLHAILLNNEPLIRRNPVVYTTSMRSLWYSTLSRVALHGTSENPPQSLQSRVFCDKSLTAGHKAAQEVSRRLRSDLPLIGPEFSKKRFSEALDSNLDIIHYHAHATSQADDPLEQALKFEDGLLTVREYLDMTSTSKGHHITLLGCGSGVTVGTTSNEPLGLVPAFMNQGAASIVSALWRIDDGHASMFSDVFYESFSNGESGPKESPDDTIENSSTMEKDDSEEILEVKSDGRAPLPAGWEMRLTESGREYFVDHEHHTTTWVDPRTAQERSIDIKAPLPAGWEMRLTDDDRIYFVDHNSKTTTFSDPRQTQPSSDASDDVEEEKSSDSGGGEISQGPAAPHEVINLALATQKAVLNLMYDPIRPAISTTEGHAITRDPGDDSENDPKDQKRAPLRKWAGFVLNGWWIMNAPKVR